MVGGQREEVDCQWSVEANESHMEFDKASSPQLRSRHAPRDEPNSDQRFVEQSAHHAERDGYVEAFRNNNKLPVTGLVSTDLGFRHSWDIGSWTLVIESPLRRRELQEAFSCLAVDELGNSWVR